MKILHFLWSLENGGAENLAIDLANDQCRVHEVTVFVANDLVDEAMRSRLDSKVRFLHLGRAAGSRNPFWLLRLVVVIRSLRPDVVHSHSANFATVGRFVTAPLVLTVHANNVRLSSGASRFAAICCISQAVQADIRRRYPQLRTTLINNGIRTSSIAARSAGRVALGPVRAVQISRLRHDIKGQDLLIEAVAFINQGLPSPCLTVDFIGDGPSRAYLCELVRERGVEQSCRIMGTRSRDEVYATLRDYDVLIQPSRDEGFGLTIAEGMAAGIDVVVSDLEGPMQVIEGGKYGEFFRCGDASALACTLKALIDQQGTKAAASRREAARRHAIDNYDLVATSNNYVRLYQELLAD